MFDTDHDDHLRVVVARERGMGLRINVGRVDEVDQDRGVMLPGRVDSAIVLDLDEDAAELIEILRAGCAATGGELFELAPGDFDDLRADVGDDEIKALISGERTKIDHLIHCINDNLDGGIR